MQSGVVFSCSAKRGMSAVAQPVPELSPQSGLMRRYHLRYQAQLIQLAVMTGCNFARSGPDKVTSPAAEGEKFAMALTSALILSTNKVLPSNVLNCSIRYCLSRYGAVNKVHFKVTFYFREYVDEHSPPAPISCIGG